jgi:hypothetical protein
MKTDDLIRAIAGDAAAPRPALGGRMAIALAGGGAVAAVLFALDLGMRPDIAAALQTWRFVLKVAVMLVAFACALWACIRLAQPGTTLREVPRAPRRAAALAAGAIGADVRAAGGLALRAMGRYSRVCLLSIPMLSIPLAALMIALRAGAPRSPLAAGALAGGLAGALGALLYATHCPDDSPLFVALWYAPAVALVVLAGAAAGYRVLRW